MNAARTGRRKIKWEACTVTEIVEKVECSSYKNKEWKRRPRTGSLLWSESYQVNEQRTDYKDNYYTGELQKTPIACPLSITSCFVFWQIFGGSGLHQVIQTTDSETHGFLSWPAFLKRSHDYRLLSDPKCLQLALGPGLENRLGTVNKRGADNRWGHWRSGVLQQLGTALEMTYQTNTRDSCDDSIIYTDYHRHGPRWLRPWAPI